MFSKVFITLLAASSVLAAPGGSYNEEPECSTTCSTELCTQSSVYEKTTEVYETKTVYYPVTTWVPDVYEVTKTLTTSTTSLIVTETPVTVTTVIYEPVTLETCIEVPYTTVCEETTSYPEVTSTATLSVCTEEEVIPYTTQWVETQTTCETIYAKPTGGWGGKGY